MMSVISSTSGTVTSRPPSPQINPSTGGLVAALLYIAERTLGATTPLRSGEPNEKSRSITPTARKRSRHFAISLPANGRNRKMRRSSCWAWGRCPPRRTWRCGSCASRARKWGLCGCGGIEIHSCRRQNYAVTERASDVIREVYADFERVFGRKYGNPFFAEYMTEDAEGVLLGMGTMST